MERNHRIGTQNRETSAILGGFTMARENTRRRALLVWMLSAIVCFTLSLGNRAYGQISVGTINGIVTDSQGSAIVGASVSVKNTDTRV